LIRITSLEDKNYNCIAWAAEEDDRWWWPTADYYWPVGVDREETVDAFVKAFEAIGYERCVDGTLEAGFQKVAIYASSRGVPTHAARQLPSGDWTSKMGSDCDIEHSTVESVRDWPNGRSYGSVAVHMRKPR
jgi:hypothetical protein